MAGNAGSAGLALGTVFLCSTAIVSPIQAACTSGLDGSLNVTSTCVGDLSDGAYFTVQENLVSDLTVKEVTADVTRSGDSPAIGLGTTGSNGDAGETSTGTGGAGGDGQSSVDLTVSVDFGKKKLTETGVGQSAVSAKSTGGTGGEGGTGAQEVFSATGGDGGAGGAGSGITLTIEDGRYSADTENGITIYAGSHGGKGGQGGEGNAFLGDFADVKGGAGGFGGAGGSVVLKIESEDFEVTSSQSGAIGVVAVSEAGKGGQGGEAIAGGTGSKSEGGKGGKGGDGGSVTLSTAGTVTTSGSAANAVLAQSLGGAGGAGGGGLFGTFDDGGDGAGSGNGGSVTVTNAATLKTTGSSSSALKVQSIGGFAGEGARSGGLFSDSGSGGSAGTGGTVIVGNTGKITTSGDFSAGVLAQSIGGGGGSGGFSGGLISVGSGGGQGGNAGSVDLLNDAEEIGTTGNDASGLFAQSVGGGGGNGGNSGSLGVFVSGSIGGGGGDGGDGDTVYVNFVKDGDTRTKTSKTTKITTEGDRSHAIFAQSVGGTGGNGGASFSASVSLSIDASVAVGGDGGTAGGGGKVHVAHKGTLTTKGKNAHGILAQSIGGGGGNGGFDMPISIAKGVAISVGHGGKGGSTGNGNDVTVDVESDITTEGFHAHGISANSHGGGGGSGGYDLSAAASSGTGISAGFGGDGGGGGVGGTVTVTSTGTISTTGETSYGILAQSLGGGGGNGGFAIGGSVGLNSAGLSGTFGGDGGGALGGGAVKVTNSGKIITKGENSDGIHAQSLGGGGGSGGFTVGVAGSSEGGVNFNWGGTGGDGATGDTVTVINSADVTTEKENAAAIRAQSIGGGGGTGGFSVGVTGGAVALTGDIGGRGGDGSTGGTVSLTSNTATIETKGKNSFGVQAQSVGGGGGHGGFATSATMEFPDGANNLEFGGDLGGKGGHGNNGGNVTLTNHATVKTFGENSTGVMAQSVGGGGGSAGFAVDFNASTTGSASNTKSGSLNFGGTGGGAGNGDAVTLTNTGAVTTTANNAFGVLAHSVGGGGGHGGFAVSGTVQASDLSVTHGGAGGKGGDGGKVILKSEGKVVTKGELAHGVVAQSIGGGGGAGGFAAGASAAFQSSDTKTSEKGLNGAVGGDAGDGSTGGDVDVTLSGDVETSGNGSHAAMFQSIGGGGGAGGFAGSLSLEFGGDTAASASVGGTGGDGSSAGFVKAEVSSTTIKTTGTGSYGLYVQSVGGGGGDGGAGFSGSAATKDKSIDASVSIGRAGGSGGFGGEVRLENSAGITTTGARSHGIVAQSIGGGGGAGGMALDVAASNGTGSANATVGVGGGGGTGNHASKVTVENSGDVGTSGSYSHGMMVQSVGGGGGYGGADYSVGVGVKESKDLSATVGGTGGAAGDGGEVEVTHKGGTVSTTGRYSHGLLVQSIGGGGGAGGAARTYEFTATNSGSTDNEGTTVGAGETFGGQGGVGGIGGTVTVTNDSKISTKGSESSGMKVQSIGGGGGAGGNAITGIIGTSGTGEESKETKISNFEVTHGGDGGDGNHGGKVTVTNRGSITTDGNHSRGIHAQSIGGGGGSGGNANSFSILVAAKCPDIGQGTQEALKEACKKSDISSEGSEEHQTNLSITLGGSGGGSSNGETVTVTNAADISTKGSHASAISAQSIGAGGGSGGNGTIGTENAFEGSVGDVVSFGEKLLKIERVEAKHDLGITLGGSGGASGNGGSITITHESGLLKTEGKASYGIFAHSIGGGGGEAMAATPEGSFSFGFGGTGGSGGEGGDVEIKATGGEIETSGQGSHGIYAQSIGGGGGLGGAVERAIVSQSTDGTPSFALGGLGDLAKANAGDDEAGDTVVEKALSVLGSGEGSGGSGGNGGDVTVTSAAEIKATGEGAIGIYAQSVGGAGGAVASEEAVNQAVADPNQDNAGEADTDILGAAGYFHGSAGLEGDAGTVKVTASGKITTSGDHGHGIFAQSAGGKGKGGAVTVEVKETLEAKAGGTVGILAQSNGDDENGKVEVIIAENVTVTGALASIQIMDGDDNLITNRGHLTTHDGSSGTAVYGDDQKETIDNYGTITGSIDLGDGANQINNKSSATLRTGEYLEIGSGGELLNEGTISPGGHGSSAHITKTEVRSGKLTHSSSGTIHADVNLATAEADLIEVAHDVELAGKVLLDPTNASSRSSDSGEVTVVKSSGTLTHHDTASVESKSPFVSGSSRTENGEHKVSYNVDMKADTEGNSNHDAIKSHIAEHDKARRSSALKAASASDNAGTAVYSLAADASGAEAITVSQEATAADGSGLDPLVDLLFEAESNAAVNQLFDQTSPEPYAINEVLTLYSNQAFMGNLFSCGATGGAARADLGNRCAWLQMSGQKDHRGDTEDHLSYDQSAYTLAGGFTFDLPDQWRVGVGVAYDGADITVSSFSQATGDRYQAGVHLGKSIGRTDLGFALTGGYASYDVTRTEATGGTSSATQASGFVGGAAHVSHGFDAGMLGGGALTLVPAFDARVTHLFSDDFTETGGTTALDIDADSETFVSVNPSITFRGDFAANEEWRISPFAKAGLSYYLGNGTAEASSTFVNGASGLQSFTVDHELDRLTGSLDLGLNIQGPAGLGVSVGVNGEWGAHQSSYGAGLRVNLRF